MATAPNVTMDTDDPANLTTPFPKDVVEEMVRLFKLFADETRLRILQFLRHRSELNVQTICELLGQTQPAVSHHLALLRVNRLIEMRRDGKHNFYRLVPGRISEVRRLLVQLEADPPAQPE